MGSLIFGSGENQLSYLDERKSRRSHRETPEGSNNDRKLANMGAAQVSYYAKPSAAQELRDRLTIAPGSVSRESLQQATSHAIVRRGNNSESRSDYFAHGMGGQDDQKRRTRRMFEAQAGDSLFKLG